MERGRNFRTRSRRLRARRARRASQARRAGCGRSPQALDVTRGVLYDATSLFMRYGPEPGDPEPGDPEPGECMHI